MAATPENGKAPVSGSKVKLGEKKFLAVVGAWVKPVVLHLPQERPLPGRGVQWTPAWSQAPPGPPPRVI